MNDYVRYRVQARNREPLLRFMLEALHDAGCRILHEPPAAEAPFRITFETAAGERIGIIAYAFTANTRITRNRPTDEHRFQVKYGSKVEGSLHELWQDPYGLYTTLFLGIDPELGIFVGADPALHSPTRFFISVEYKHAQVERILETGWHAWERQRKSYSEPIEVLVGGIKASFLRYIRLEREALDEAQGHRQLLAERAAPAADALVLPAIGAQRVEEERLHALTQEFELSAEEVLDLIANARRLKMAVRGWVAEEHLVRQLRGASGVSNCARIEGEGQPDVQLRFEGSRPLTIECKNVARERTANGQIRLDFQRTRASKVDPCSRYYSPNDFDIVAACLHAVTERWEFRYVPSAWLDPHGKCEGKLTNNVRLDDRWQESVVDVLRAVVT